MTEEARGVIDGVVAALGTLYYEVTSLSAREDDGGLRRCLVHEEAIKQARDALVAYRGLSATHEPAGPREAMEACRLIVGFHDRVFPVGLPLTQGGRTIDHSALNEACAKARATLSQPRGDQQ